MVTVPRPRVAAGPGSQGSAAAQAMAEWVGGQVAERLAEEVGTGVASLIVTE